MRRPRRKARARGLPLHWEPVWASDLKEGPKTRLGASDSILSALLPTRLPAPLLCHIESFAGPPATTPRDDFPSSEPSWQSQETARIPRALRLTCGKHKRLLLAAPDLPGAEPRSGAKGEDWELEPVTYCSACANMLTDNGAWTPKKRSMTAGRRGATEAAQEDSREGAAVCLASVE